MSAITQRLPRAAVPFLLALAVPATAQASTLSYDGDTLVFAGAPGGTYVTFDRAGDGRVIVRKALEDDFGALPASCEDDGSGDVLCSAGALRVQMGDAGDSVSIGAPLGVPVAVAGGGGTDELVGSYDGGDETISGGAGDDIVKGMGGNDQLDGGDGQDTVEGGDGADTVLGGAGADKVAGDPGPSVSPDVIDGGPGLDRMEYEHSTVGREHLGLISLTLDDPSPDGFDGEGDDVRGVETVMNSTGGRVVGTDAPEGLFVGGDRGVIVEGRGGDDEIYTSYDNDRLDGGAGDDKLRGYSGDDHLVGGPGRDQLFGDTQGQVCNSMTCGTYSGNDVLETRDGEADSLDCGLGTDRAVVDALDVTTNCETVEVANADGTPVTPPAGPPPAGGPTTPKARVTVAKRSLRAALAKGLRITVRGAKKAGKVRVLARSGKTVVARGTVTVRGGSGTGTVRFTPAAKRRLRAKHSVKLHLSGAGGISATVTLKR